MKWRSEQGQVTVFLCLILVGMLVLTGVLVDGVRIRSARAEGALALQTAAASVLPGYDSRLKERYGLLGYNGSSTQVLKEIVKKYLFKNLMMEEKNNPGNTLQSTARWKLYNYRVETLELQPMHNFSENDVTRRQVVEFMRYRGPIKIAAEWAEKIDAVQEAAEAAEVYRSKTEVDTLAAAVAADQEQLSRDLWGAPEGGYSQARHVNGFPSDQEIRTLRQQTQSDKTTYEECRKAQQQWEQALNQPGTAKQKEAIRQKLALAAKQAEEAKLRLIGNLNQWNSRVEQYIQCNRSAAAHAEQLQRHVKELQEHIQQLKARNASPAAGETGRRLQQQIRKDTEALEQMLAQVESAVEYIPALQSNIQTLEAQASNMVALRGALQQGSINSTVWHAVMSSENYTTISWKYQAANLSRGDAKKDTRLEQLQKAQKLLSMTSLPNREITSALLPSLPSRWKRTTPDLAALDGSMDAMPDAAGRNGSCYDEVPVPEKPMDFSNMIFSDNAFSFVSSFEKMLEGGFAEFRDELYIDEYILGMFKNVVLELEGGKTLNTLRGEDMKSFNTYFDAEVEYILHGRTTQTQNVRLVNTQVLLLRFVMNTLHIYLDSEKRTYANEVAAACAAWWSGGLAVPVIANLIMCGWGMGEAVGDMQKLLDGEKVPFLKYKGDWCLDLGLPKTGGQKSPTALQFSYHDYLRVFLLLMNPDTKMSRLEDLIQLNLGGEAGSFRLVDYYTRLRVESQVSVNYLFITQPFASKAVQPGGDRHVMRLIAYQGY